MSEKIKKVYAGTTLDPDVVKTVKGWAEEEDRSFSYYVNQILIAEIERREKAVNRKKVVLQGLTTEEPKGRRRIVRPKEVAK